MTAAQPSSLELAGLDGSNPLAFLAALGTLRTLSAVWPDATLRLHWEPRGAWRPVVLADRPLAPDSVLGAIEAPLQAMSEHAALAVDDNLRLPPEVFREYAMQAVRHARESSDRRWADFAAAFGCDAACEEGAIQDTAIRTMSGAGHQHFLKTMRDLAKMTTRSDLERSLFQPWEYTDDKPSLRWDPADDRRYALRWKEPSGDPILTMRGANRLAIEALPLFPTAPVRSGLETTGFRTGGRGGVVVLPSRLVVMVKREHERRGPGARGKHHPCHVAGCKGADEHPGETQIRLADAAHSGLLGALRHR